MKRILSLFIPLGLIMTLAGCPEADSTAKGVQTQEDTMQRAIAEVPVPEVTQFTTRETVARWIETANNPDQTHYIYVMLPGVGFLGYYVADSAPVNICVTMTPAQRPYSKTNSSYGMVNAPALDGVYYNGGGCGMWYFFDAETGAKIEVGGQMAFFTTNMPLMVDIPELRVEYKPQPERPAPAPAPMPEEGPEVTGETDTFVPMDE